MNVDFGVVVVGVGELLLLLIDLIRMGRSEHLYRYSFWLLVLYPSSPLLSLHFFINLLYGLRQISRCFQKEKRNRKCTAPRSRLVSPAPFSFRRLVVLSVLLEAWKIFFSFRKVEQSLTAGGALGSLSSGPFFGSSACRHLAGVSRGAILSAFGEFEMCVQGKHWMLRSPTSSLGGCS